MSSEHFNGPPVSHASDGADGAGAIRLNGLLSPEAMSGTNEVVEHII